MEKILRAAFSIAVLTVPYTRSIETDTSGQYLADALVESGRQLISQAKATDQSIVKSLDTALGLYLYFGKATQIGRDGICRGYQRTQFHWDENAEVTLSKYGNQDSGTLSSVSWIGALAEVEIGQQITPGDKIKYYLI